MVIRFRVATTVFILSFSLLFSACTSGVTRATSLGNPHLNTARQLKNAAVSSFPQCSNNGALIDYDNTEGITYIKDSCVLRNGKMFRVRKTFVTNGNPNWAPYVEDNEGRIAVLWEWIGEVSTPPVTAVDITITAPSDQGVIERPDQDIVFSFEDGLGVVPSWIAISVNGNVVPVSCNVGNASASCHPADPLPAGEYTVIVTVTAPSGASDTEQVAYRILDLPPDPGEAGKATLLGIGSENDGVRDDIQRYIELTYPDSARKRAALRQYAKTFDAALKDASNKRKSINNAYKVNRAQECTFYIWENIDGSSNNMEKEIRFDESINEMRKVKARILNTQDRTSTFFLITMTNLEERFLPQLPLN